MGLALKIAWRNIWRHRGKSLVIGVIVFIGAMLMTLGNGIISGMEKGLSDNIVQLFTGDVVIISNEQETDDVLFGSGGKPLKVLRNYPAVKKVLESQKMIRDYLPVTAGMVFVFNSGSEFGSSMLLGVDMARYQEFFPDSFKVMEGRIFKPGERGVILSELAREQAYYSMNFWLQPTEAKINPDKLPEEVKKNLGNLNVRRELVFMGANNSNTTMDVRVPVIGIIKYKSLNRIWGNYGLLDIESFREAHNYVGESNSTVGLSKDKQQLLENDQLDRMFSSGTLVDDTVVTNSTVTVNEVRAKIAKGSFESKTNFGTYNLIFLKTQPGVSQNKTIKQLNNEFRKQHLGVRAVGWKDAVGSIGSMAVMIKGALNVFILFIYFVAIIIIMNTLSMAALERVAEIAMMRAIGAHKSFMGKMFIYETGLLSFFFGGIGIVAGVIIIVGLRYAHISTANELLQVVYGGDRLNPLFTIGDLLLGVAELVFVTFLAVLYPLQVVGKIVPLDAVARE